MGDPTSTLDLPPNPLDHLTQSLLEGADPRLILQSLEALQASTGNDCPESEYCGLSLYVYGLANELAGEERAAVEAYLNLWSENPDSPLGILARMKLHEQ